VAKQDGKRKRSGAAFAAPLAILRKSASRRDTRPTSGIKNERVAPAEEASLRMPGAFRRAYHPMSVVMNLMCSDLACTANERGTIRFALTRAWSVSSS
jgi:hypothetical protein